MTTRWRPQQPRFRPIHAFRLLKLQLANASIHGVRVANARFPEALISPWTIQTRSFWFVFGGVCSVTTLKMQYLKCTIAIFILTFLFLSPQLHTHTFKTNWTEGFISIFLISFIFLKWSEWRKNALNHAP